MNRRDVAGEREGARKDTKSRFCTAKLGRRSKYSVEKRLMLVKFSRTKTTEGGQGER